MLGQPAMGDIAAVKWKMYPDNHGENVLKGGLYTDVFAITPSLRGRQSSVPSSSRPATCRVSEKASVGIAHTCPDFSFSEPAATVSGSKDSMSVGYGGGLRPVQRFTYHGIFCR